MHPEPTLYTRTKDPPAPKLGPFRPVIDEILEADQQAPPKQRHTAAQIFRRLHAEHGYQGGYDQVRRYVGKHRRRNQLARYPHPHAGQNRAGRARRRWPARFDPPRRCVALSGSMYP